MPIGPLAASELAAAAELLARAFRDNPLNRAVIGGSERRRLRSNRHGMRVHLPLARRHGQVLAARSEGALAGALIATPPGAWPLPAPPLRGRLRALLGQGLRVAARWADVFDALDACHPRYLHWYLGTLGVDPAFQGRGLGSALLEAWLAGVDADGRPAWLETDRERNLPLYARHGFAVADRTAVLGVPLWLLARPGATRAPGRIE